MDPYLHPFASEQNIERATRIFEKLMRFVPDLLIFEQKIKFEVEGYFAPICFELIDFSEGYRRIQMHHCWSDGDGDLISDPRIVFALYLDWEMAEVMMCTDMFCFEEAYPIKGGQVDAKVHSTINNFLERWLDSLLNEEQSHRMTA